MPISQDGSKAPAVDKLPRVWCGKRKKHVSSWTPYMERLPTLGEIKGWFSGGGQGTLSPGIAVIGGHVSGGLEILDLDNYDLSISFKIEVEKRCPGLLDKLVAVTTPRPGLHLWYRCKRVEGSQKLASIRDPKSPRGWKTAIETKGAGGYCLAPPSPGDCHPLGKCYAFETDMDLTDIQTISISERQTLFDVAESFDQSETSRSHKDRGLPPKRSTLNSNRPGDDYNRRVKWEDLLLRHGWKLAGTGRGGEERWTRPGKDRGWSATVDYANRDLFHVFSVNAFPFEADRSYTKFHAYALLEHGGNFSAAASKLARQGYGRTVRKKKLTRNRSGSAYIRTLRKLR